MFSTTESQIKFIYDVKAKVVSNLAVVTAVQDPSGYEIAIKRFNEETGEAIEPDRIFVTIADLEKVKANLQGHIDVINNVITNLNKL